MKKPTRIEIATVVFYDGVEAYTTHRALYVYYEGQKITLTNKSKQALKYDIDECSGCEILKVDFNDKSYEDASDFMHHFDSLYRCDESAVSYVKDKFIEYFVVTD